MTQAQAPDSYLGLLRATPPFRWLWLGTGVSTFGDAVQGVALIWLATQAPSPGLTVAVIATSLYLPQIVLGPFAGAIADRFNRRHLMVGADAARVATALAVPFAATFVGIWSVAGVTLVHAALGTLFYAGRNAALPEVTGTESLVRANGLLSSTNTAVAVAGAAIGGGLVAVTPLAAPFALNAATFAASGLLVLFIPATLMASPARAGKSTYLGDVRSGLSYARGQPPVLVYMLIGAVATIGFAPAPAVIPVFATQELGVDSVGLGLINGVSAIGYTLGAALIGRWARPRNAATAMAIGYLAMGGATLLLAVAPNLAFVLVLILLRTGFNAISVVTGMSILQAMLPNEVRGRVYTLTGSVHEVPRPLILPTAGFMIDAIGARVVFAGMAVFIVGSGLVGLRWRRLLTPAEPEQPEPRDGCQR
jgi:DHA3 family macrolide efflux protein-like MFS transporter